MNDNQARWKKAVSAYNAGKRRDRWKRPPKPITGIVIIPPAPVPEHGETKEENQLREPEKKECPPGNGTAR
jgi:hypothetical protein